MIPEITPEMIQFVCMQIAILFGVFASFVLPYIRKKLSGEIEQLDPIYIYHLVITALWEFIVCFAIYSAWKPPIDVENTVLIIILAFFFGFGGSDIQKEIEKDVKQYFEGRKRTTTLVVKNHRMTVRTDLPEKTTDTGAIVESDPVIPTSEPETKPVILSGELDVTKGLQDDVEEITQEPE